MKNQKQSYFTVRILRDAAGNVSVFYDVVGEHDTLAKAVEFAKQECVEDYTKEYAVLQLRATVKAATPPVEITYVDATS
jgi:hypothetical protein